MNLRFSDITDIHHKICYSNVRKAGGDDEKKNSYGDFRIDLFHLCLSDNGYGFPAIRQRLFSDVSSGADRLGLNP